MPHTGLWLDVLGIYGHAFGAGLKQDPIAGQRRNQKIISEGRPHLLVAFPGGNGTAEMIRFAKSERLEIIEVAGSISSG